MDGKYSIKSKQHQHDSHQIKSQIHCEKCKKKVSNVLLVVKMDPRNFRLERARLCKACSAAGGFRPMDWGRGNASMYAKNN